MQCSALKHVRSSSFNCLAALDYTFISLTLIVNLYLLSAIYHCKVVGKKKCIVCIELAAKFVGRLFTQTCLPVLVTHIANQLGQAFCLSL